MKRLFCLLLLQLPLYAQLTDIDIEVQKDWERQSVILNHYSDQNRMVLDSEFPIAIRPFELYSYDLPPSISNPIGTMEVAFDINENGEVENPIVLDTFNVELNKIVIDKVKQTKYKPARQNGRPVKVKFKLPIVFK